MTYLTDLIAAEVALIPVSDRAVPGPTTLGYGIDLDCVMDVTATLDEVDPQSLTAIGQAIARRLITPRGNVADDQNYGLDLRAYCNRGVTVEELRSLSASVRGEAMKDARVADAKCDVTYAGSRLIIKLAITPQDRSGPFALVFFVTADGIQLIESIDA